jgi:hexosaminidase
MWQTVAIVIAASAFSACATRRPSVTPKPAAMVSSAFDLVIPRPTRAEPDGDARFTITGDTVISVSPGSQDARRVADFLARTIGTAAAATMPAVVERSNPPDGAIALTIDPSLQDDRAYELVVRANSVAIRARDAGGLFNGIQSFRQLMPPFVEYEAVRPDKSRPVTVPTGRIVDAPRFEWRGVMLDVSRHFFSVDEVKRFIDLIVHYKFNRLHLHLSDDQGWRIEIRKWPNLAQRGGMTEVGGGPGGFYTQEQFADLVRYAADRFVTIVPEIDMPGHTNAALASYAELNCDATMREPYTGIEVGFSALCIDSELTYTFIDDVIGELAALTPGSWIHIGGDEVKTVPADQYRRFIERVQSIVGAHGKQMIGWDEIAPARLDRTTLVQHWRPNTTPTFDPGSGPRLIMSMANKAYLDQKYDAATPIGLQWAGLIDVRTAYEWDPATVAGPIPESALAGVEAPLWSETTATMGDVEFLVFPRLLAIAEVAWSQAGGRDWDSFRRRLGAHGGRLTALGVNFHRTSEITWQP